MNDWRLRHYNNMTEKLMKAVVIPQLSGPTIIVFYEEDGKIFQKKFQDQILPEKIFRMRVSTIINTLCKKLYIL